MTQQANFKRRVRERMAKTGERYSAARLALIESAGDHKRTWHSQPEVPDASVIKGTGHDWDTWCDRIEAWPGDHDDHAAIAKYVHANFDVTHWWSQGITIGFERITGRRLPGQMSDGTFTANKSKTMDIHADMLRALLLDADSRAELFPGYETELRSRPTSKAIRIRLGPGVASIALDPAKKGTRVVVAHEKLPDADAVPEWKFYWGEWLDALAESGADGVSAD